MNACNIVIIASPPLGNNPNTQFSISPYASLHKQGLNKIL